jgi:hypothetical protein
MGFALDLALRYMRSRKRGFISLSTVFAIHAQPWRAHRDRGHVQGRRASPTIG